MITGVVLAAGGSSRFGRTKQLALYRGVPLVQYAVDALEGAGVDELLVVLGHDAPAIREALRLPANARVVENPDHAAGQSTSLTSALRAAHEDSRAVVVLLADQPGITSEHVRALVLGFDRVRSGIVRLRFRDGPGPSVLGRDVWPAAMQLAGDTGARALADASSAGAVLEVRLNEDLPPDVDTEDDLRELEGRSTEGALGRGPGTQGRPRSFDRGRSDLQLGREGLAVEDDGHPDHPV